METFSAMITYPNWKLELYWKNYNHESWIEYGFRKYSGFYLEKKKKFVSLSVEYINNRNRSSL